MLESLKTVTRRGRVLIVGISAVGLVLVGLGLALAATREKEAIPLPAVDTATQPAMPPIDVAAPTETKIATFALG
jgi:hypothetical protein